MEYVTSIAPVGMNVYSVCGIVFQVYSRLGKVMGHLVSKPTRTVHGKGDNSQTWPDATCSS